MILFVIDGENIKYLNNILFTRLKPLLFIVNNEGIKMSVSIMISYCNWHILLIGLGLLCWLAKAPVGKRSVTISAFTGLKNH